MNMKKIMFNDKYGLTQAVLEGRKTQTRRIIDDNTFCAEKTYYKIGEEVAIAQSYKDAGVDPFFILSPLGDGVKAMDSAGWGNKMFVKAKYMPHRINITDIRIKRLQDISDEDCLKEGIGKRGDTPLEFFVYGEDDILFDTPQRAFAVLFDKVSGKGTWESNPFVFVYDFELIK